MGPLIMIFIYLFLILVEFVNKARKLRKLRKGKNELN